MRKITLFAALLCVAAASAETIESVETRYYTISPQAPWMIRPELMRNSPIRERRGSFNGRTDWYINWYYQPVPGPQGCRLQDVRVEVKVLHTLPALSDKVQDAQTIEVFNRFNEALTQHERNHGQNGLDAAREIDRVLSALPPQPDCRYLGRLAEESAQGIVQQYSQKDRDYDYRTRNGETEGAVIY